MPKYRYATKVLEEGSGGKKNNGRPKKKWLDAVVSDARIVRVEEQSEQLHSQQLVKEVREN